MFYSPLVELIERLIKKANHFGSRVYWGWILISSFAGGLFIIILDDYGFQEARPFLIVWTVLWLGGIYPVHLYERHWKSKRDK